MQTRHRQDLSGGWKWRLADTNGDANVEVEVAGLRDWTDVTAFPSVIQMELLAKKIIPDPNVGENERVIQWVGHADWEYSCSFQTPKGQENQSVAQLVFEGLDTFATVTLNGKEILKSDNMFTPYRVDVKSFLRAGVEENELRILFTSPIKGGDEAEKKFGKMKTLMRDARRMVTRKAQYHYGWDWGPRILTIGPWMPVYLETYHGRIEDIHIVTNLSSNHSTATVSIDAQGSGEAASAVRVKVFESDSSVVCHEVDIALDEFKNGSATVTIQNPKLWWPNGQGEQHLYTISAALLDESSKSIDEKVTRFGIRTIELVQQPLDNAPGKTFMFRVNGRDIFMSGANWIPTDMLLPTITRQRYFDWIQRAKQSHLNMLRVWGGGIYESEDFLDACDEMGILVWHDFALACGDYPIHPQFLANLKAEVEAQVTRLRNRACLAMLCGNNEDFILREFTKVPYDFADHKGPFEDTEFPSRKIFLQLFPEICQRIAPNTFFWPSSPWGDAGTGCDDLTFGDVHQWHVWHLEQKSYQKYKDLSGRFVSEFGMHAFPIMRTIDVFVPPSQPEGRFPQSRVMDCHNKSWGNETRIARYLSENFRFDMKFENFVYCSHLLQSEALGYALRDWKRKFNGRGKELCAGALIWQLNDVYPGTSWSFLDYYLRPKPAFYSIRRYNAPISIGVERTPRSRYVDDDHPDESKIPSFEIFAFNSTPNKVKCVLNVQAYDFAAGKRAELEWKDVEVSLNAGYNTELVTVKPHPSWTQESLIILETRLIDTRSGKTKTRYVDWPEPFRYLTWPADTKVDVSVQHFGYKANGVAELDDVDFEDFVTITANQAIKGCWLEPIYDGTETESEPEPWWEDNMIDLVPCQEIKVGVNGLRGRKVKVRFLADWEVGKNSGKL